MAASAIMVGVALASGDRMGAATAAMGLIPGGKFLATGAKLSKSIAPAFTISRHATEQMAARGVSRKMVAKALEKGVQYNDRKHPGVTAHVLEKAMASGRTLYVAKNRYTNRVTTVMIRSKFKAGNRWYR